MFPDYVPEKCGECGGSGKQKFASGIAVRRVFDEDCPECNGTGEQKLRIVRRSLTASLSRPRMRRRQQ